MDIGRLNQRVELQSATTTCDAMGQPVQTWATVATVWAEVSPLTGREFDAASAANSEVELKVIIRYYSGLTSHWRLLHGTKVYQILTILNLSSGKKDLKLMCKEQPAAAV
jgi:SPP1 family predicted phage head-tail adaptor